MAGGFLGLPGLGLDPLQNLQALTSGAGAGQASSPPPPSPAPAPVADPATTGSIDGGGGSSRGIGDMISDAFSGRGLMGARPGDDKVDPTTGATAGQMRQVSMQGMMAMGMTLLAAGMRQTDDQRAAILSKAPSMLNGADSINNFAKMRLEMANARLKEREAANADERMKRWQGIFGGSGAASGVTAPSPATAAPMATPGTIGAPAALGSDSGTTPSPAGAPIAAPAPVSGAPVQPQGGGNDVLAGISPATRQLLGALGPDKGMEKLYELRKGLDEQTVLGDPTVDDKTGKVYAPQIKNGKVVGMTILGDQKEFVGPTTVDKDTGVKSRDIMRGGNVVRQETLGTVKEDPQDVEERAASARVRYGRYEDLYKRRPEVAAASESYNRLVSAEENLKGKKTLAGFGANQATQVANILGSVGLLTDEGRQSLINTNDVNAFLQQSAGEFAKKYYGPQISNADVENAKVAIGGVMSNDPEVVANALKRIRMGHKQTIDQFNRDVDNHDGKLKGIKSDSLREDLRVGRVDNAFAEPKEPEAPKKAPEKPKYTADEIAAEMKRRGLK